MKFNKDMEARVTKKTQGSNTVKDPKWGNVHFLVALKEDAWTAMNNNIREISRRQRTGVYLQAEADKKIRKVWAMVT